MTPFDKHPPDTHQRPKSFISVDTQQFANQQFTGVNSSTEINPHTAHSNEFSPPLLSNIKTTDRAPMAPTPPAKQKLFNEVESLSDTEKQTKLLEELKKKYIKEET
jgi:hypothetical protein